ncbi:hypothetical protein TcWFU_001337 [Taenia crassiceps]|uniref:Uncharacterized protein n=1 Tax=Taenia crassiceps TaxID=6207 RepID=A0ABR4QPG6_9CEST
MRSFARDNTFRTVRFRPLLPMEMRRCFGGSATSVISLGPSAVVIEAKYWNPALLFSYFPENCFCVFKLPTCCPPTCKVTDAEGGFILLSKVICIAEKTKGKKCSYCRLKWDAWHLSCSHLFATAPPLPSSLPLIRTIAEAGSHKDDEKVADTAPLLDGMRVRRRLSHDARLRAAESPDNYTIITTTK